jgi:hypothetical protein
VTSVSVAAPLVMLRYKMKLRSFDRPPSAIVESKERNGNKNYR